jgi:hypothetical protein
MWNKWNRWEFGRRKSCCSSVIWDDLRSLSIASPFCEKLCEHHTFIQLLECKYRLQRLWWFIWHLNLQDFSFTSVIPKYLRILYLYWMMWNLHRMSFNRIVLPKCNFRVPYLWEAQLNLQKHSGAYPQTLFELELDVSYNRAFWIYTTWI